MHIDGYNLHGYLLMCMNACNLKGMRIGNHVCMVLAQFWIFKKKCASFLSLVLYNYKCLKYFKIV